MCLVRAETRSKGFSGFFVLKVVVESVTSGTLEEGAYLKRDNKHAKRLIKLTIREGTRSQDGKEICD